MSIRIAVRYKDGTKNIFELNLESGNYQDHKQLINSIKKEFSEARTVLVQVK